MTDPSSPYPEVPSEPDAFAYLVTQYGQACVVADSEDTRSAHDHAEALYDQVKAAVGGLFAAGRAQAAADIRPVKRRLFARIVASSHLLDKPFSDEASLSPWELIKREMNALSQVIDGLAGAAGGAEGDPSKSPGPADDGNALSPEHLPRSARGPAEPEDA